MSAGGPVLSSLREGPFDGQQSNQLFEIYGLPQNRNRALRLRPLNGDFNQCGRVVRLFGFHHFEPPFNSFLYIAHCLIISLPLGKTPGKCGDFSYIIACFVFFDDHMQFHDLLYHIWTLSCQSLSHINRYMGRL